MGRRQLVCQVCGKSFNGAWDAHYCEECADKIKRDVIRLRTCQDCGKKFYGGPRARRCPECREAARIETDRRHRKEGTKRPIGSTDVCLRCGEEYTVKSGRQKYCPSCSRDAVLEWQRERKKEYNDRSGRNLKRQAVRRAQKRICPYCLREFSSASSSPCCSEYCRVEQKKFHQCEKDIARGRGRNLKKYEDKRASYREKVALKNPSFSS